MTQPDLARLEGLSTRLRAKRIDGDLNKENGFGRDRIPDPDCEEAATEIEALLARVRELTEALEPFASISRLDHWDEAADRQQANVYFGEFKSFLGALKVSDFRQAALTLNRSEPDAG